MSVTLQFKLTQAGQAAAFNATSTGLSLDLTHVQVGSGNRVPDGLETALVAAVESVAIAAGYPVTPSQIRMTAVFTGASAFAVREVGLWAGAPGAPGSVLVCYWSQASGDLAVKAPGVDFVFSHDMVIDSAVSAGSLSVVVDPDSSAVLALVSAHEQHANPHPQYTTNNEVQSLIEARVGNYVAASGAADNYVVALSPTVSTYNSTTAFTFRAHQANAGGVVVNAGGGNKALLSGAGLALAAGAIQIGDLVTVVYDEIKGAFVITATGRPSARTAAGLFKKADFNSAAFVKTGAGAISIKAGTMIDLDGLPISFATQTPVTMPTLTAGTDYSIWCTPSGALQAVADPFNAPAAAPVAGAIKIGGFHCGLVASGTTVAGGSFNAAGSVTTGGMVWTQAQVDDIAGINKYSIWDLKWRSAGEQHGFAFDPMSRTWVAIYFAGTNHGVNGVSRYNTDVASGTVLPRIPVEFGGNGTVTYPAMTWWASNEIACSHRARLLTEAEFVSAAFGVTENQSLGGAASTIPATTRQAGYTSRIGLEQATGHIWTWGADSSTRSDGTGGWAWRNNNGGRGQMYIGGDINMVRVLLGGYRGYAAFSGSRASDWYDCPWDSGWGVGLRAACDHLQLA